MIASQKCSSMWYIITMPTKHFAPTGIFPMLQMEHWKLFSREPKRKRGSKANVLRSSWNLWFLEAPLCEKWRCRHAAGGSLRRQAFFQCVKLCLKPSYHVQSTPSVKNGVAAVRQEAFCADRHFSNASNFVWSYHTTNHAWPKWKRRVKSIQKENDTATRIFGLV